MSQRTVDVDDGIILAWSLALARTNPLLEVNCPASVVVKRPWFCCRCDQHLPGSKVAASVSGNQYYQVVYNLQPVEAVIEERTRKIISFRCRVCEVFSWDELERVLSPERTNDVVVAVIPSDVHLVVEWSDPKH